MTDETACEHRRRECDICHDKDPFHSSPCINLQEHLKIESKLFEEVAFTRQEVTDIKIAVAGIKDMLDAWNNAKGFYTTIKNVGKILGVIALVVTAVMTCGELIKHWLVGK